MRIFALLLLVCLAYADTASTADLGDTAGEESCSECVEYDEVVTLDALSSTQHVDTSCSAVHQVVVDGQCLYLTPCTVDASSNCAVCDDDGYTCVGCVENSNGDCLPNQQDGLVSATKCDRPDGTVGLFLNGMCQAAPACLVNNISCDDDVAVGSDIPVGGSADNTGVYDVNALMADCVYNPYMSWDPTGMVTCNQYMAAIMGTVFDYMAMADVRCYNDRQSADAIYWGDGKEQGVCDCAFPKVLGSDGACHELTCVATADGAGCRTCADPLTRNNECGSCHEGYVLHSGDCLENTCTENPDDWDWQGCQECRPQESRRHPQDCLTCAHGYRFLYEQRHSMNQTSTTVYSSGSLVVQNEETGYCFPYHCTAGGNLLNANFEDGDFGAPPAVAFYVDQRTIKLTPVVSTDQDDLDPSVPELSEHTLMFRDHCKTCVPQQKREKDDHCETCNPGYYLDEMHHTCRKKTCGVPHFRRNAVSCTADNLVPKPWSTPCETCEDNSLGDDDACCVYVPPVLTCGAQNIFCAPGTHKAGYDSLPCGDCTHYNDFCCDPMTCDNQQVACRTDQNRVDGGTVCEDCLQGGDECCVDKPRTCGNEHVKCGFRQHNKPADTLCEGCQNDGLECCTPITTTCQNTGVFCYAGTHMFDVAGEPVVCSDCENYGAECCAPTTCDNQRVACQPGREPKGDVVCEDCIANTLECCEPLPPVQDTCGNQLVKCEPRLYRPAESHCESSLDTCNDYGETCCFAATCGNQGVGCSDIQARRPADTLCVGCHDGGDECCIDARTCGLMGVQCILGGYNSPDTPCVGCNNFDETECCHNVAKTCQNQGVVCLSGTHRSIETGCEGCQHYGSECCAPKTCGNQNVGCSRGRARLGDDVECDDCGDDSDDCCASMVRTCSAMGVKCMEGHYNLGQAEIDCGDGCTNYAEPCCRVFEATCGNQNVVCSDDQSYMAPTTLCNDCVNQGSECCVDIAKTCQNQGVVCRPAHNIEGYADTVCGEDCLNDSLPCCEPYVKTCGSEDVVCGAEQTYGLPSTECALCENNGGECCTDIPTTCDNQKVVCRPGHYADDYMGKSCVGCKNDDESECCVPFIHTCGNQNVQCNAHQVPRDPQTVCDDCTNDTETCCIDVADTCANQNVVCRAGHYKADYADTLCAEAGCLNDAQPCCVDYVPTCGTENVKCSPNQTYKPATSACNGACENYGSQCCLDTTHTCGNQGVICRPGYYTERYQQVPCEEAGCTHHSAPCCDLYLKTCGNQDVECSAGQTYLAPGTVCDDCDNRGSECCVDIQTTCDNQNVVCRPGHYAADYAGKVCDGCLNDDEAECCTHFQTTCGNQNVKCDDKHVPENPATPCDGEECTNNSAKCCLPVTSTCANQNVVCRPDHYAENYAGMPCASAGCLNDVEPCCVPYVKTCANQNVQCALGLKMHKVDSDIPCEFCMNYGDECCEPIVKTCGSHGQDCRQDLYLPQDTECDTCDVTQCCLPIPEPPMTCANSLYLCNDPSLGKIGFYKPGDTVCDDVDSKGNTSCNDELCCHSFPVNCGNQNVQCHDNTYKSIDTLCTDCVHYGSECCEVVTCASAGVTCDSRYYDQVEGFASQSCSGASGECVIDNDSAPCCLPKALQAQAPTCINKYGIDQNDLVDWPFMIHWNGLAQVTCEASQGYYPRLMPDGTMVNSVCGLNQEAVGTHTFSSCQTNDPTCCWRKTCIDNLATSNGNNALGSGLDEEYTGVTCPDNYSLKDNAQYIVCNGDCVADCCDKIPDPDTCMNQRVACSYGYERKSSWETQECGEGECTENSSVCCQRTACTSVTCDAETQTHKAGALCFDCYNNGEECCDMIPIADTCSNQRVSCGYGMFKVAGYEGLECENCYDNGDECCVEKTCGNSGIADAVQCTDGVSLYKELDTRCYTCVDDGAECCDPFIPAPTCQNQGVNCGFGLSYHDLDTECEECIDNGDECCYQNTCGNTDAVCDAVGLKANADDTPCTLCLSNGDECCTAKETCWTAEVVCPADTYHKHPNTICGDSCDVEHCCAAKTCENQGVCCNKNLGFSEVADMASATCTNCADNCEECCTFDTPTCGSATVGCGFGYHRKKAVGDEACSTCALNDPVCCEPRTCGADLDIDDAFECGEGWMYLGDDVLCHYCERVECCRPIKPTETCRSENINCGVGMARIPGSADTPCTNCVQNDEACCEPLTCDERADCPVTMSNKGSVLCVGCTVSECCDVIPTCASENVGCGIGMKPYATDTQECSTCALNDAECCEQLTCGSEGYECPSGFQKVADQGKKCAFCELSECCEPIIPTKTCSNQSVGCGLGFHALEGSDEAPCGTCELNNPNCCGNNVCGACPEGFHAKDTVHTCGLCTVEECCNQDVPPDTCDNQEVGCGFGMKEIDQDRTVALCSTCAHNDPMCCEPKTCGADGPDCSSVFMQDLPYTEMGAEMPCSDCDLGQCCVPPVIQQTCVNQRVGCGGHFDNAADYATADCENCLPNGDECCVQRTCASLGVMCNRDLFTVVTDYETRSCMECADNTLECCEPKLCGHEFLDADGVCDPELYTTLARNTPCVGCDVSDCCEPLPTLKCAEIEIPNGQAFYSEPAGTGSGRTRGSVLSVECDLGFKFQAAEYTSSSNLNTRDQDITIVDYPVCDPILIEEYIEGHVEVFSPTTSGWNRAPPVCRPVTCPPLNVESLFTPDAVDKFDIGFVTYVDAQMDPVPQRGAGYGPRDYAGEANVVCNEGWIRVPNVCSSEGSLSGGDHYTENTLEYELKGFWRLEGNTLDNSPHCTASRTDTNVGSCNDGTYVGGAEAYVDGASVDGAASGGLMFDGLKTYIEVHDNDNPNWGSWKGDNELNLDSTAWTATLMAKIDEDNNELDGYMFARYTESYKEIVTISLTNGWLGVIYNDGPSLFVQDAKLATGRWVSVIVRMDGEKLEIWVDGVMKATERETEKIADTSSGHVYIGADRESSGTMNGFFDGQLDEVRYYTRGITDEEIACLAAGKTSCSASDYYAKPYNTQGCNRASEEITSADECREAITQLLQDSVLGNSLNGGQRFGKTIRDDQKEASYDDVPAKCSYREEDAQIIFNPAATGRAHTSLAPICKSNPTGTDLQTIGCLPKCLDNGKWSVALPTCEKDWCNPIFEEWSCCANRIAEKSQSYYLNHHNQDEPACPIGYGDCDDDTDCLRDGNVYGLCSQQRDLDNIDVCITDLDPCGGVMGATGTMCVVMTAVGMDYHASAQTGHNNVFLGGAILVFGSLAGYYMMNNKKGDEHRALLEEEL